MSLRTLFAKQSPVPGVFPKKRRLLRRGERPPRNDMVTAVEEIMNDNNILRMEDIQVSNILYYDPAFGPDCYSFCKERNIDCLPALENSKKIFVRQNERCKFVEQNVTDERIVQGWLNIFEPELADKFAKNALLLVFSHNTLTGVVHFSDYNQPIVSIYLYKLFLAYEKALRTILELRRCYNKDMIEYFEYRIANPKDSKDKNKYMRKIKEYENDIDDIKKLPEFQSFYLSDLIELTEHQGILFVDNNVTKLRNMVMHAHDFVHMEDPHTPDLIYNPKTFQDFFKLAITLHADYRQVANHLAFINKPRTSQETHA